MASHYKVCYQEDDNSLVSYCLPKVDVDFSKFQSCGCCAGDDEPFCDDSQGPFLPTTVCETGTTTQFPTQEPSSSSGECIDNTNACGYDISLEASHFKVCLSVENNEYESHCLLEEDINLFSDLVAKCGCCETDFQESRKDKEIKFCGASIDEGPRTCLTDDYVCGETKDGKVKVLYTIYDFNKEEVKEKCKDPLKAPLKEGKEIFCGCGTDVIPCPPPGRTLAVSCLLYTSPSPRD